MIKNEHIKNIAAALPGAPGVYQYFDNTGKIIYVGKAKNLKKRVSSYFNKTQDSLKVKALVKNICDIKYIVVANETDALLLENNLIKQHQPHYNILLKDGKTYPWLCITKEEFPRVFRTRKVFKGGEYFGPFCTVWVLDLMLELIREIYPIRTCKLALTSESIRQNKHKLCLEYHIKNCKAPCELLQTKADYNDMIHEIREIAKGNSKKISNYLINEIQKHAENFEFEKAQELKEKYEALIKFQSKTIITTATDNNFDVFSFEKLDDTAYINMLHIANGSIVQGTTIEYFDRLESINEDILATAILELRSRLKSETKQVIVPFFPNLSLSNVEFIIPQKGDKKKLLDLSYQNVKQYKLDKLKQKEATNPDLKTNKILQGLKDILKLDKLPEIIECFDNSNISGSDAVAACVVYKKAKPSKKDYRKYNIKTVEGVDDYASMREIVYRRYSRIINENTTLPDLIIADGGLGQMSAIRDIVKDELNLNIPILGLAKNDKHKTRELLFGNPPQVISIKPTDLCFKFLSQIQEEVHRVAIEFHRDKRSKSQTASELDQIKGIGEKTKHLLLNELKSVKRIQNANFETLKKIIGTSRASIVYNHFNNKLTP